MRLFHCLRMLHIVFLDCVVPLLAKWKPYPLMPFCAALLLLPAHQHIIVALHHLSHQDLPHPLVALKGLPETRQSLRDKFGNDQTGKACQIAASRKDHQRQVAILLETQHATANVCARKHTELPGSAKDRYHQVALCRRGTLPQADESVCSGIVSPVSSQRT